MDGSARRRETAALRYGSALAMVLAMPFAIGACEVFSFADRDIPGSGGAGGGSTSSSSGGGPATGGGGSGGSATGAGGDAPGIECIHGFDCPGNDTDCVKRACVDHRCGVAPEPDGTPTSTQVAGDCQRSVCDGMGGTKLVNDDTDVLVDGNPCTDDTCAAGVPQNLPSAALTPCAIDGGTVCDDTGLCVACVTADQCAGAACVNNACVAITCVNGMVDPGETDVDCGGAECPRCMAGQACAAGSDCVSAVCAGSPAKCQPPSCGDKLKNGIETDVDCGGECPVGCAAGQGCAVDLDCAGGSCLAGVCQPTCTDGAKNLDETGVDCGGSCPVCADGQGCVSSADCNSGTCAGGTCVTPAPECADTLLDGTESDVDCGGPSCAGCAVGLACVTGADCASGRCTLGICAPVVLISEVRTRGIGGAPDEFVELYNPLSTPLSLDASWTLSTRSAVGTCSGNLDKILYTGAGETIPPHGHLLLGGSAYAQMPAADVALAPGGLADAGSLVLAQGGAVVDALCWAYDDATKANLLSCSKPFTCEGMPASNLPHDNTQGPASNVDASLSRKPGGALGSGRDTGSSVADFQGIAPARPESLASPATP